MRCLWVPMVLGTGLAACCLLAGCGGQGVQSPPQTVKESTVPAVPVPAPPVAAPAIAPVAPETPPTTPTAAAEEPLTSPTVIMAPEVRQIDQEGAGKLYQVGSQLVCVMEGTHAEMGFQHGRLLADRIRRGIEEGYFAKALLGKGYARDYINAQSARMEKHFPPEYIEEIKGVVAGLKAAKIEGITYEDIRALVCIAELQHHPPNSPPGCTNFALFGKWTPDGRLLHGRNLDWNVRDGAQENAVILVWRPQGGTPFMMPTWGGCIGGVSGMSARGITIGEMTSKTTDETFDGIPLLLIMRHVLEKAATLDDAVAIMRKGPRTLGWNFVIGDAKIPDARALEVDAVTCEVFAPMDLKENEETGHQSMADAVRRTNHPCGKDLLMKLANMYGKQTGMALADLNVAKPILQQQNTWQRYDWLGKQIEARPRQVDVDQALQFLCNGPVKNNETLHSWVFDPNNRVAYVAIAGVDPVVTASSTPYTKIDLKGWF